MLATGVVLLTPVPGSEVSERIVGHCTDGIRIFASVGFLSFQVSLSSYRAGRAPYEVPGGFSKGDVIILMVIFLFLVPFKGD